MRPVRQTSEARSGDQERTSGDTWLAIAARTNYPMTTWLERPMGARELVRLVKTLATQVQGPGFEP